MMGGFYERLVGLVKRALRKTIGRKHLTLDQMSTVTKEAESVVNSRPLVYVGDDLKSSIAITPRHFTCLNPNTGIPESETEADEDPSYDPYEKFVSTTVACVEEGGTLVKYILADMANGISPQFKRKISNKDEISESSITQCSMCRRRRSHKRRHSTWTVENGKIVKVNCKSRWTDTFC